MVRGYVVMVEDALMSNLCAMVKYTAKMDQMKNNVNYGNVLKDFGNVLTIPV